MRVRIVRVGEELAVVLPTEAATRLGAAAGGELFLREEGEGFSLGAGDPHAARHMAYALEIMKERTEVLRELAK